MWHHYLKRLVDGLNMDLDSVYQMSFISSLNWLSYFDHVEELKNREPGRI